MAESAAKPIVSARHGHLRAVPSTVAADAPHPVLVSVRAELADTWTNLLRESFSAEEVQATLSWLVRSVHTAASDADSQVPPTSLELARFLLEQLSSLVIQRLEQDASLQRQDILSLMRGVDATRRSILPDWDRYFPAQMSGPDGLNIVLEVAHDLRSPLTSIRCLAESIERGQSGPVTDLQRKQLQLIYSASLGLSSMATDVIELAQRGEQLTTGEAEPFSLSSLLEGVADMVRPIAEEKGVAFSVRSVASDVRTGIPVVLTRVLLNLVTNALKFTDEGEVEVSLRTLTMSRVEFSVRDTGHGIPESAIPDLFRPFRRTTARMGRPGYSFSGTGLGLALCRKLLLSMNSELRFETRVGVGTRFFFEVELPTAGRL